MTRKFRKEMMITIWQGHKKASRRLLYPKFKESYGDTEWETDGYMAASL